MCKEVCINEEKYIVFDLSTEKGEVFQDFNEFQAYGKVQEKVEEIEPVKEVVKQEEKQDLWTIFLVAFASGFLALLTPCVFPMIPMTVSFFTKQSKNLATGRRNAILYGIFIVVIYVLLGSIVTGIFGADALNALSTNVWFNLIFFLLLVVFAISFFGAFEIMLPNSWANAVDRKADRGGIVGIFFYGFGLGDCKFQLYRTYCRNFIGASGFRRRYRSGIRNARFFIGHRDSVCFVCFVSRFDELFTKIWRLVKFGKSGSRIFGACLSF